MIYASSKFLLLVSINGFLRLARSAAEIRYQAMSTLVNPNCHRLLAVEGDSGKQNDIIFYGNIRQRPTGNVVFFGGDVQDYSENMMAHRDNHRHVKRNLESTAEKLYERFPNHHIWVVRPFHMQLKTFSVYSNFVMSNEIGGPTHSPGQKSWTHLHKLLQSAVERMERLAEDDTCQSDKNDCEVFAISYPTKLIAFSKGCVVLNQLLYDLEEAKTESQEMALFLHRVETMYWLDGGHSSGMGTWVVSEAVLKSLIGTAIEVQSHVTPYQINDNFRTWIRKEQKLFVKRLRRLGVSVTNVVHFEELEPSIEYHFDLITEF